MSITIVELAQLAGVSDTTVSLVLNGRDRGRVSAARREKILALAQKHGYRPNLAARGLSEGRHYRIAMCVSGSFVRHAIVGHFSIYEQFALFAEGVQAAGHSIELIQVDTNARSDRIGRELAGKSVDGFVLLRWPRKPAERFLLHLKVQGFPGVACGTRMGDTALTWTDVDRREVFVDATRRLIEAGHRRIGLLIVNPGEHARAIRSAFTSTMKREVGKDADKCVFTVDEATPEDACRGTTTLLKRMKNATALLLNDTFYGEAVLDAVRQRGQQPGKDIRILAHGNTLLADRSRPGLSHYTLRTADQAAFGLETLLDQIHRPETYRPRHRLFGPEYLERGT